MPSPLGRLRRSCLALPDAWEKVSHGEPTFWVGKKTLRARGLAARIHADDVGDVVPPEYVDFTRPVGRVRNEAALAGYSRDIGARVAQAVLDRRFVLLLGGDCSIVLGGLLGARRASNSRLGLV